MIKSNGVKQFPVPRQDKWHWLIFQMTPVIDSVFATPEIECDLFECEQGDAEIFGVFLEGEETIH